MPVTILQVNCRSSQTLRSQEGVNILDVKDKGAVFKKVKGAMNTCICTVRGSLLRHVPDGRTDPTARHGMTNGL